MCVDCPLHSYQVIMMLILSSLGVANAICVLIVMFMVSY
jgi:hypothetical protein